MADGSVVIDVKLNSAQAQSGIAQVKAGLGGIGAKSVAAGQLMAEGIKAGANALVGFAKDSIQTGMTFEQSMSNVAALSGASGAELEALSNKAKEMGSTTTFSASQCADALSYMALAGWDSQQSIDGLDGVLALAQAGQMDLAAASDLVTDALSAFGMAADESSRMADVLAFTQANANTSADQMGAALKNCAVNAHSAGMDIETTSSILGMFSNEMLKGSEAGTALTAITRDMTAKMKDGAISIGETKVAVADAQGNYRDFADILRDVEAATDGMGETERNAALATTFTADSIKGMGILLNEGSDKLVDFRDGLYNSSGAAQDMAAVMTDNLNGALAGMNSAIEGVQIQVFEAMAPLLTNLANTMTGSVIPAVSNMVTALVGGAPVFDDMGIEIGKTAGALAPLIAKVKEIGAVIAPLAAAAVPVFQQIASAVGGVLGTAFTTALSIIKSVVQAFSPTILAMLNTVNSVMPPIKSAVEAAFKAIEAVVNAVMPVVGAVVRAGWAVVSGVINAVVKPIAGIVSGVFNTIAGAVNGAMNTVKSAINSAKAVFSSIASSFSSVGSNIVSGIVRGVTGAAGQLMSTLQNLAKSALNAAKNALGIHSPSKKFEKEVGEQSINGMIKGIENKKENAKKKAAEVSNLVLKAAEERISKLKKAYEVSAQDEYDYWEKVKSHVEKGSAAYKGAVQHMKEAHKQMVEDLRKAREEAKKTYAGMVDDIAKLQEEASKQAEAAVKVLQDSIEKRTESILKAFKLWDEYKVADAEDPAELKKNLDSQVSALEQYTEQLGKLHDRLGDSDLFEEVKEQGVDALAYIKALNEMTDEAIAEYAEQYEKRNAMALEQAKKDNAKLAEQTQATLNEIETSTAEKVKKLTDAAGEAVTKVLDSSDKAAKKTLEKIVSYETDAMGKIAGIVAAANAAAAQLAGLQQQSAGTLEGVSLPAPKVEMHAKGGIMTGATVLHIGGEAGNEGIIPLEGRYMQPFADAIAERMGQQEIVAAVVALTKALPNIIASNTPDSISINKREFGRLVREV